MDYGVVTSDWAVVIFSSGVLTHTINLEILWARVPNRSFDFVVYLLTHTNNTSTYEVEKIFMQIYPKIFFFYAN